MPQKMPKSNKPESDQPESTETKHPREYEYPFSLKQPIWHVVVLSIATMKVYFIYWCYKTWRDYSRQYSPVEEAERHLRAQIAANVAEQSGVENGSLSIEPAEGLLDKLQPGHLASFKDTSAPLRGLCMLIPYVNDYLFAIFIYGISKLHPDLISSVFKHPMMWTLALGSVSFGFALLAFLPGAWYLLYLLSAIPMIIIQVWVNKHWDEQERGQTLIVRHAFSGKELFAIIAGALCLGFIIASFILGANK